MASTLPNNPSLDRLRDDARRLQRGITATDRQALELVRRTTRDLTSRSPAPRSGSRCTTHS